MRRFKTAIREAYPYMLVYLFIYTVASLIGWTSWTLGGYVGGLLFILFGVWFEQWR